jgi:hypothetical protein
LVLPFLCRRICCPTSSLLAKPTCPQVELKEL